MTPRLAATAAWCREIAIPALVLAWIAASGFVGIDRSGAAPVVDRLAQSLTADAKIDEKVQPIAPRTADVTTVDRSVTPPAATETTQAATTEAIQLATTEATQAATT